MCGLLISIYSVVFVLFVFSNLKPNFFKGYQNVHNIK